MSFLLKIGFQHWVFVNNIQTELLENKFSAIINSEQFVKDAQWLSTVEFAFALKGDFIQF